MKKQKFKALLISKKSNTDTIKRTNLVPNIYERKKNLQIYILSLRLLLLLLLKKKERNLLVEF